MSTALTMNGAASGYSSIKGSDRVGCRGGIGSTHPMRREGPDIVVERGVKRALDPGRGTVDTYSRYRVTSGFVANSSLR